MTSSKKTLVILGATGSVGRSTIDLVARNRDLYDVLALTALRDVEGLAEAARAVGARQAVIGDETRLTDLRVLLAGTGIEIAAGEQAIVDAAALGADWTMAAIVGCAGLRPTMAALRAGRTLALANKESLVSAGDIMMDAARQSGARILPVDSEHNAIFQCFDPSKPESVRRIILTASGGPFREESIETMRRATPDAARAHPNWDMGAKISVDSATLMNKGLELIEAYHLFPLDKQSFQIIVHPQSIVHSMVEYIDGSVLAQLGPADMRVPIAHTLAWPERMDTPCTPLDLLQIATLTFEKPDPDRFPALELAGTALRAGGAKPAILNAANEIAVAAFLDKRIGFLDIVSIARDVLDTYDPPAVSSLDDILEIDRQARATARQLIERY